MVKIIRLLPMTLILLVFWGCCSTPAQVPIGTPARPVLVVIPNWDDIQKDAQDAITVNDLELKAYATKLEKRIKNHDKLLE